MSVERTNRDIQTLIAQITAGEIMLPEIQRGYVWKASQVAKLMESLYRGYPAGSLLLWKTDEAAETRPAAIGATQETPNVIPLYLLDGQQRLTSLYRVFTDHPSTQIVFNVETETFQNQSSTTRQSKKWVKVFDVVGPDADTFAIQADLRSAGLSIDGPEIGRRITALAKTAQRDFHMEILHDFSYEQVSDIFVRVNSGGRALKTTDLAMATLSARSPGFLGQLEEESARWVVRGYRAVDVNFLIKALTLSLSISGRRTSSVAKLTTASKESVAEGWERVKRGLDRVVPLLQETLLLPSTSLITSISALHPLIVFYGRRMPHETVPKDVGNGLLYWFLAAMARNRYTGATDTNLTQDINALDHEDPVRALLANLRLDESGLTVTAKDLVDRSVQSPYLMLSYLAAAHAGACDWWDGSSLADATARSDKLQYSNLHPASKLRSHRNRYSASEINDLANIVFVSKITEKNMIGNRAPAAYVRHVSQGDLAAHAVPADPVTLEADGYREFLSARRALLAGQIMSLLRHFRPASLSSSENGADASRGDQRSLKLAGYTTGNRAHLVAEATLENRTWTGLIDPVELGAALDAAGMGLDSDVTVAGEAAPVMVDEEGVTVLVGPFLIRGALDQWRATLKNAFEDPQPADECPEFDAAVWPGEAEDFFLSEISILSA
ncbi:GmrSD restriction endonuclease domain-containing protein [Streptomyces sp. UC4497]